MPDSIVFAGTPPAAALVLQQLVASGIEVSAVITKPDAPVGRKKIVMPSAVADFAQMAGLRLIKSHRIDESVLQDLTGLSSRLGVIVAYGSILNEAALSFMTQGWFNLHFSLLPKYRGAAPVQRALQAGEEVTGVTLFRLDAGIDTGQIVSSVQTEIAPDENASDLLHRLAIIGATLLQQELPKIAAGMAVLSQQEGISSSAPKLTRAEAQLDFKLPANQVHNLIRASNPEPGAWIENKGFFLKVHSSRVVAARSLAIGELVLDQGRVLVGCGQSSVLELLEVQPAGKTRMLATDWYRGAAPGMVFT